MSLEDILHSNINLWILPVSFEHKVFLQFEENLLGKILSFAPLKNNTEFCIFNSCLLATSGISSKSLNFNDDKTISFIIFALLKTEDTMQKLSLLLLFPLVCSFENMGIKMVLEKKSGNIYLFGFFFLLSYNNRWGYWFLHECIHKFSSSISRYIIYE